MAIEVGRTYYIAGPMSGIPHFNVPEFHHVAGTLRAMYPRTVFINPAELDSPRMQTYALASEDGSLTDLEFITGETWGEVLARDVKTVADYCDGLILLPGWQASRGARLEAFVGILSDKQFYMWREGDEPEPLPPAIVKGGLL